MPHSTRSSVRPSTRPVPVRAVTLRSAAALALTCLLAACGGVVIPPSSGGGTGSGGSTTPTPVAPAPITTGIQGTLVAGNAAEPLVNALVQAIGSGGSVVASATTDSGGHFTIGAPAGSYTLLSAGQNLVAAVNQGGSAAQPFAASQVVGVPVVSGSLTTQDIVQVPATGGSLPASPPKVVVSNVPATLDAQGTFSPSVVVDTQVNSVYYLITSIGKMPVRALFARNDRIPLYVGGSSGESGVTTHVEYPAMTGLAAAPGALPVGRLAAGISGSTFVETLAIDTNNDRTLVLTPVTVGNVPSGGALSSAVANVNAIGYTIANSRYNAQGLRSSGLGAQAATSGALVYGSVSWTPAAFSGTPTASAPLDQGYRVYRARNGGGKTLVGTLARYASGSTVINPGSFLDTDPLLTPGDTLSYTVVAFDGQQNAPESAASPASLLAPLTLKLTGPADQATGVSVTPTFSWTTNAVGKVQYFVPALDDTLQGVGSGICGLQPVASPANTLIDTLQQSALDSSRGFYFNATRCGVVGGAPGSNNTFTYAPGQDYNAFLPPLQSARSYQWRMLESIAADDANAPHAISVFSDDAGLFFSASRYTGLTSYDGDQVFTFTTGGNQ